MREWGALFFLILVALVLLVGFLTLRLRDANRRLSGLYHTFQENRRLVLFHLEHLEAQVQQMPNLAIVWDTDANEWQFKGRLGAEGLMAYVAACRKLDQGGVAVGEDLERIDGIIRASLQRLARKDWRYYEQVAKLLTDQEHARWLSTRSEGPKY